MMAKWSNLPPELILCIAKRMDSLEDFIVVGTVCKSWRSANTKENYFTSSELRSKHHVPLLVLPQEKALRTPRKVLSLTKDKIFELNLSPFDGKRCYSSLGWVFTVSKDQSFSLIHPLNHARIELPNEDSKRLPLSFDILCKFFLSSSPSWTSDYTVILMGLRSFAVCRPGLQVAGEKNWTVVSSSEDIYLVDIAYYKGQLYVVGSSGRVYFFDTTRGFKQAELRAVSPKIPKEIRDLIPNAVYLVESGGELLLVLCSQLPIGPKHINSYQTSECRAFKIVFSNNNSCLDKLEEVKSLGNRSLFLSRFSSSLSVEASCSHNSGSQWKPNCIYFMNGVQWGRFRKNDGTFSKLHVDMGIFHMDDGHIERPFADSLNKSSFKGGVKDTLHFWVEPSF